MKTTDDIKAFVKALLSKKPLRPCQQEALGIKLRVYPTRRHKL